MTEVRSVETPWLTPEEAAAYVRRGVSTIYAWIGERRISSYKPDGKTLLLKSDIDAFLKASKRELVRRSM